VQHELFTLQRAAESAFQSQLFDRSGIHTFSVELITVPPCSFTACKAAPAFLISVCGSAPSSGVKANAYTGRGIELVTVDAERRFECFKNILCNLEHGLVRTFAILAASSLRLIWVSSRANLSPANRATVSLPRRQLLSRSPMLRSNRSPVLWPRVSLMFLKRSRSSNITASICSFRWARFNA